MELSEARKEIDKIDSQLTELFAQRMNLAHSIAQEKMAQGLPVYNQAREREILARVCAQAGEELETYTHVLFSTLFDLSRSYQNGIIASGKGFVDKVNTAVANSPALFPTKGTVACQGVEGAYSQKACDKLFSIPSIMYFRSFEGVFSAVESGLCQFGILPIENSSYGSVTRVYDLMREHNFHIVKSIKLRVSHALLAKKGVKLSDIREVCSHEQAIGQCGGFLRMHPEIKVTMFENTAAAAKYAAESERNDIAAICSADCAELYGMSVISHGIQDTDNNYTRFICIAKDLTIYSGADRISLMLSVPHRPGALYSLMSKFSALGLNMTKLESRPIPGSDFEFMFYFDFEASLINGDVVKLLGELSESSEVFVFLGSYSEKI